MNEWIDFIYEGIEDCLNDLFEIFEEIFGDF